MAEVLTAQKFGVNTSDSVDGARLTLSIKTLALIPFAYLNCV